MSGGRMPEPLKTTNDHIKRPSRRSKVSYGTTIGYGSASSSAALTTSHAITITGLTASTTYDFQLSSADGSSNLATSGNQAFTIAAYNYYVDSVNGNDANSGTSPSSAFADFAYFANTAIPSGSSIGVADGSYIRSQLLIGQPSSPRNNITLTSYGTGINPVIDASDIIPPNCWTLVASTTYSCSVAGPGTTFSTHTELLHLKGRSLGCGNASQHHVHRLVRAEMMRRWRMRQV
jgi:hypothetical protein